MEYGWPGNVRELQHTIEKAIIFCESNIIKTRDLFYSPDNTDLMSLDEPRLLKDIEKIAIENSIARNKGNLSRVAKELGITRTTLYKKIRRYDI